MENNTGKKNKRYNKNPSWHRKSSRVFYDTYHDYHTWVEISKNAIDHNITQYKKIIGNNILAPVIKANAYGHGLIEFASVCQKNKNVDFLCTATLAEAIKLRASNITKPILVLSYLDSDKKAIANYSISVVVYDIDTIKELDAIGKQMNHQCKVHIKVDTGLSRLGINPDKAIDLIQYAKTCKYVYIEGIWTHFAEAQSEEQDFTNQQINTFIILLEKLKNLNIQIPYIHASNTASTSTLHIKCANFYRIGIGLYGYPPSRYIYQKTRETISNFTLKPVLTWKTKIFNIKEVPKNTFVGYNRTYQTKKQAKIATLPIGYFEGYDRKFSNKGYVYIKDKLAPIVGLICMNVCMVDVTGIKNISIGDEAILIGDTSGIRLDELATIAQLNLREITTKIHPHIPRIIQD